MWTFPRGRPTSLTARLTTPVNLTGVFNSLKHEFAHMAEHGGGTILNTTSTAGRMAAQAGAAYGATKHEWIECCYIRHRRQGLPRRAQVSIAPQGALDVVTGRRPGP